MRVEVLVARGADGAPITGRGSRAPLLTYAAPVALADRLQAGQVVVVPVGRKLLPGIVWALDASDDLSASPASPDDSDTPDDGAQEPVAYPLRTIHDILTPEPLLLAPQRALAEWIAAYYCAPLGSAARLLLPPGLLASLRLILRPTAQSADRSADHLPSAESATPAGPDDAVALALLQERGWLEHTRLSETLGGRRAQTVISSLMAQGRAYTTLETPLALDAARLERRISLNADAATLAGWRSDARARLDALGARSTAAGIPADALMAASAAVGASAGSAGSAGRHPKRRGTGYATVAMPSGHREVTPQPRLSAASERQAERILRQLAVLEALEHTARTGPDGRNTAEGTPRSTGWTAEQVRKLTRVTEKALAELVAAGLIVIEAAPLRRDPLAGRALPRTTPLALSPAQAAALRAILSPAPTPATRAISGAQQEGMAGAHVVLLHGVTGSGKTEVYLQALAAVIARGQRGLVLVPEIALTPQAMARFAGRFPGRVALLHSGLTDAERRDEWRRIRQGEVDVVLGSRSALFAPVERLGLIVVDEEHEAAYKQDRTPTYSARDVAVKLGALSGATVVLGSATPSIESYWRARQGAYRLVELRERAPVTPAAPTAVADADAPVAPPELPPVTLVDLRAELRGGNTSILSAPLQQALQETLDRGEQAILFLNRRGSASCVLCRECGYVARCHRCDVSMTWHAGEQLLICHYCGRQESAPQVCPLCWSASIRYFGLGTERVEFALKRQFPQARTLRWDRDTARTRQAHEDLLRAFSERRADFLVGTQMIAKGLDLPAVTLVGVVSADIALFLPDFRASERAFQLLTQVAGRAGRGQTPGRVIVQTFNPDHFCIQAAARHDYDVFSAAEIAARERYGYPPFRRFVKCTFEHADRYTAQIEATALAERLERILRDLTPQPPRQWGEWDDGEPGRAGASGAFPLAGEGGLGARADLVGPAPAFIERLRGRYRWQVILRGADPLPILRALEADDLPHGWSIDVDPATSL